jgi:hypothetical protein
MNPHAFPTMPDEAARLYRLNSYTPDFAGEIDSDEEILAEEIGVTPQVAALMLDWVRRNKQDDDLRNEADMLARVFSTAIPPKKSVSVQLIGLRFLALYWLLNSTGESLTDLAGRAKLTLKRPSQSTRVSKQILDYHAKELGALLNFHGYQQKAKGTTSSYSQAQRSHYANLSPEERRQRRAGKGKTPKPKPIQNKHDLIRAKMLELQRNR